MSDLFELEASGRAVCAHADAARTGPKPFALAGDRPHYSRDLTVDVRHIKLDIRIDPKKQSVRGTATHYLSAINDGVRSITFDAAEMTISAVTVGGKPAKFDYSDPLLRVDVGRGLKAGVETEIAIVYSANPRRGLYFTAPDKAYPDKPLQAWTQGQDEDSRHWYPCLDYPNHQQTSEVIIAVPVGMISIGNGELRSLKENKRDKTTTYHWYQATPHVTYLLSQIVGDFAEIRHDAAGVPVEYFGPRGREADIERTLARTPAMLRFFGDLTGVPYPYARYAQTFVADFIFGGMENVSATTLTDTSIIDKRASIDVDSDGLVAHELAHQWFGDLLTCRDWSHGWLNEGFATYCDALFIEESKGLDEFRYELYQNATIYMGEDGGRYRRPIVHNTYNEPIDLFDRHLYEKGSLVLHMIRTVLGDAQWRKALHHYVAKHRSTNVTTPDLQRAIEAATGRNIDWLFDQYVYRGGHPALKLAFEWDDEGKRAKLSVTQTQDEKDAAVFRLPVAVDFTVDGKQHSFKVEINEKVHNFFFALPGKPQLVRFDPGHNFLKSVEFKRGKDMLLYALKNDDDVIGRIEAAKELAKLGTREAADALKAAVLKDAFWAVQNEAARALGSMKTEYALDALLGCLKVSNAKARRGVVNALGQFRDERAAAALEGVLKKGDASYYVEAMSAHALGQTRSPRAFDALSKVAMTRESANDVVRSQAFTGMTELKDERALPIALEWTKRGKSNAVRGAATMALGKLGQLSDKAKDVAYDRLVELLSDDWLRVRLNAVAALADLKDARALGELGRTVDRDLDGRVIRYAREAMARIRDGADKSEEVRKLRTDLDTLMEENRALRDRVEKIEASSSPKPRAAKPANTTTASSNGAKPRAKVRTTPPSRAPKSTASSNGARPATRAAAARAKPRKRGAARR